VVKSAGENGGMVKKVLESGGWFASRYYEGVVNHACLTRRSTMHARQHLWEKFEILLGKHGSFLLSSELQNSLLELGTRNSLERDSSMKMLNMDKQF
jgi:hypothetical protein